MVKENSSFNIKNTPVNYIQVEEMLQVPENFRRYVKRECCDVCETPIRQLKQEAVAMIQSIQQAQSASSHPANISALVGSYNISAHHHSKRSRSSSRSTPIKTSLQPPGVTLQTKSQAYIGQNARSRVKHLKHNQAMDKYDQY
ncbi:hypothetical protein LOTGIDRAFT_154952 [Lottia gigantea]|uniref:Kinesin-like protein KIF26A/B helical domain-containing protein n=1 Tax=Lottia gigantea TaxID=225164 RepID=V4B9C4_LOTGI|nr:hypothetical protein LOTGIDRAFT_154952 [Lottia gigantea]ESO85459.1 hypothetical protein LOTGIDRAFT_154952 [Lottia gigantea]